MSRQRPSFRQLLDYIAREGKSRGEPLLYNLPAGGTTEELAQVFLANYRLCPPRRNGIALYHEVLSLAPEDAAGVTPEILLDLGTVYLDLRAPQALAFGMVHFEGANPHLHLLISANLCERKQKLRLSRQQFAAVKRALEAYQRERYPQLSRSLVFAERERSPAHTVSIPAPATLAALPAPHSFRESERQRRLRGRAAAPPSRKALLRAELQRALILADCLETFARCLQAGGMELYHRGGRPCGVIAGGRKYRFTTLGLAPALTDAAERWQAIPARRETLRSDRCARTHRFIRSFGYAEEALEALEPAISDPGLQLLRQDRRERRRRRRAERFRAFDRQHPFAR